MGKCKKTYNCGSRVAVALEFGVTPEKLSEFRSNADAILTEYRRAVKSMEDEFAESIQLPIGTIIEDSIGPAEIKEVVGRTCSGLACLDNQYDVRLPQPVYRCKIIGPHRIGVMGRAIAHGDIIAVHPPGTKWPPYLPKKPGVRDEWDSKYVPSDD